MSVLVNGMEIPRNCWECEFNKSTLDRMDFCTLTDKQYNWGIAERPSDCPLVEVPTPHGDLIERDYVKNIIKNFSTAWEYGDGVSDCWNALVTAPTIIEAEDGE